VEGAFDHPIMRAPTETIANARRLRRNLSAPEARLWSRLRARTPGMPAFRRQHPIGPYVLDFYCAKARLAVEIDGMSHDMGDRPERDVRRDAWLKARGVTVMRIAAGEAMARIDETADGIVRMAAAMIEADAPSAALRAATAPSAALQAATAPSAALRAATAPSTALRAVPLPRDAGEENESG
jgi:very-short-patch-repair endonuclease